MWLAPAGPAAQPPGRRSSGPNRNDGLFREFTIDGGVIRQVASGPVMTNVNGRHLNLLYPVHEVIASGAGRWADWKPSNYVKVDNVVVAHGGSIVVATDR